MVYIVQSSEKLRSSGAEYETKAMLYLMGCREDSHEIYYYVIDFFNDVTGLSSFADKAWDVQSKGAKNNSPRAIGKELVTLFKNYMSDFKFDYLILFLGGVTNSFRIDSTKSVFAIDNVKESALKNLKEGFLEEARVKTYIDDEWITDDNYDAFIHTVTFVVDDKSKADYIKNIISINQKYVPKDDVLDSIFNEIRDAQSSKKNNGSVEGDMLVAMDEVLSYDRFITSKEIRLKVLNSFINYDLLNNGIPMSFMPVIEKYDYNRKKAVAEDCQLKISAALFHKENSDAFWDLLDTVVEAVGANKKDDVNLIYDRIKQKESIHNTLLDLLAVKYLIAVVKEAME